MKKLAILTQKVLRILENKAKKDKRSYIKAVVLASLPILGIVSCAFDVSSKVNTGMTGSTYYISPTGNNSNPGTLDRPWKTFSFAIPRLQPGDTLVLTNGTYNGTNSGYPNINCNTNAKSGTATKPITIKAQNERQAFLQGNGSARPFLIQNCSYWNIEGLRAESGDFPAESGVEAGSVFVVKASSHVNMKRLLGAKPNRYKNAHVYVVSKSSHVLIEESEAYYFHRHGFSSFQSSFTTFRRNYANSRGYPDLPDGYKSVDPDRGDAGLDLYVSTDSIMENNISEGNGHIGDIGQRNKILGNISLNDIDGFAFTHHCCYNVPSRDGIYINNVAVDAVSNGFLVQSQVNTLIENATSINSGKNSFEVNNKYSNNNNPSKPWTVNPSVTIRNSLALGNIKNGFVMKHSGDFSSRVLEYLNTFNKGTNRRAKTETGTNSITIDPALGNCMVYIPSGSPMKGAGQNGADIGANIIYRYEDGVLTSTKLWNQTTGQFPCGATVTGINDDATFPNSSCVNVHKRLNVGVNGCAIP